MKKSFQLQHIFENKYTFLLTILILLFFVYPFVTIHNKISPVLNVLFLIAVLPALIASLRKRILHRVLLFYFASFLLEILIAVGIIPVSMGSLIFSLVFIGLCIYILTKNINKLKIVNADIIKGGISIYILMGLFWTILYVLLQKFNPAAFDISDSAKMDYLYYSFVTLSTIGYGDIHPVDKIAKLFSIFEALGGQIFLATFIARLVGIAIAQESKKD